nr:transposase domain-containing protein [uncultured Blautia sp.]
MAVSKGAFANGVLYTLVESTRANELDVYEYLKYLLTEIPNNHHLEDHPLSTAHCPDQNNCQSSAI